MGWVVNATPLYYYYYYYYYYHHYHRHHNYCLHFSLMKTHNRKGVSETGCVFKNGGSLNRNIELQPTN